MNNEKILEIARRFTVPKEESSLLVEYDGDVPKPTGETLTLMMWNFCEEELIAFAQSVIEVDRESSDEPVAYRHFIPLFGWEYFDAPTGEDCEGCVGLYTRPSPARKPLSEDEIEKEFDRRCELDCCPDFSEAVRWAEKMHGIGETE